MNNIETMKLALEALEYFSDTATLNMDKAMSEDAITALRQAIEQAQQAEPDYYGLTRDHLWMSITKDHYDRLKPEFRMACYTSPPPRQPEQDGVAMADYMALMEKYVALKAAQPKQKPVAIEWTLDGDKSCGYNNWVGDTPFGRILITWKGWKEHHDACVDEFPGEFNAYGTPDEVKAECEAEFARRLNTTSPVATNDTSQERVDETAKQRHEQLTDEELKPICDEYRILFGDWVEDFARAIEAKLKEKNT